jgi:hypothetical protein
MQKERPFGTLWKGRSLVLPKEHPFGIENQFFIHSNFNNSVV